MGVIGIKRWGFFDGAYQGHPTKCEEGSTLFINDTHLFQVKEILDAITNNYAKLMALKIRTENNIQKIQIK